MTGSRGGQTRHRMIAGLPPRPIPGSHIMVNHSDTNANKSPEPPLSYPGATPDAGRSQKPALPEPPYRPYAKKPALPEPPYKPYAKKSALPEPPYEPYAKKSVLPEPPYEPYKGL